MQTPTSISRCRLWREVLCGLCLLLACGRLAADPFVGHVDGKVLDPQGAPVEAAHVSLVNAAGSTIRAVTSDEQGNFGFADIDPGSYQLVAESPS